MKKFEWFKGSEDLFSKLRKQSDEIGRLQMEVQNFGEQNFVAKVLEEWKIGCALVKKHHASLNQRISTDEGLPDSHFRKESVDKVIVDAKAAFENFMIAKGKVIKCFNM